MSFVSGAFLIFLPVTALICRITPPRWRYIVLLAASYTTLVTTVLSEYSRTGLSQASNAINLLIIVFVLFIQFVVNKLTGASIDKGVGGN